MEKLIIVKVGKWMEVGEWLSSLNERYKEAGETK